MTTQLSRWIPNTGHDTPVRNPYDPWEAETMVVARGIIGSTKYKRPKTTQDGVPLNPIRFRVSPNEHGLYEVNGDMFTSDAKVFITLHSPGYMTECMKDVRRLFPDHYHMCKYVTDTVPFFFCSHTVFNGLWRKVYSIFPDYSFISGRPMSHTALGDALDVIRSENTTRKTIACPLFGVGSESGLSADCVRAELILLSEKHDVIVYHK